MTRKQKGFTLIELLVSISIIAILTSLLMVNFVGARQRGRDGQRKANLYQIQSALELYRSDIGSYPLTADVPACSNPLQSGAVAYMKKIPCDPTGGSYSYTSADGTSYKLVACLENSQDSDADNPKDSVTCSNAATASFTLTNQ